MSSSIQRLENIADSLNSFASSAAGGLGAYIDLGSAQKDLNDLVEKVKKAYDIFFNDTSLQEDIGEGLNLIKGDSFCSFIDYKYRYYEFRYILLTNIDTLLDAMIDDVIKEVESQISNTLSAVNAIWDAYVYWVNPQNRKKMYKDANFSMEEYKLAGFAEGIYAYTDSDGWGVPYFAGLNGQQNERIKGEWPDGEDVAGRLDFFLACSGPNGMVYASDGKGSSYSSYREEHPEGETETWAYQLQNLPSIDTSITKKAEALIDALKNLIKAWLNLGFEALKKVSFVFHVSSFRKSLIAPEDVSLFNKLLEIRETVESYSPSVPESQNIVTSVMEEHPNAKVHEESEYFKEAVFVKMNLQEKSEDLANRLLQICNGNWRDVVS